MSEAHKSQFLRYSFTTQSWEMVGRGELDNIVKGVATIYILSGINSVNVGQAYIFEEYMWHFTLREENKFKIVTGK